MTDSEWLLNLYQATHEEKRGQRRFGGIIEYYTFMEPKRDLTPEEWIRTKQILDTGKFIVHLCAPFGFSLKINIYEPDVYFGIGPLFLCSVGQKQLPDEEGTQGTTLGGGGESWKKAWEIFTVYSHSDRNRELLAYHKMEEPKDERYYEY